MAVGRITKRSVEAIPLPVGTARSYLWDDTLKGFGVMVTPAGSRSYLVQYQMGGRGSKTERYTIGRHGSPWTAEKAREHAVEVLEVKRKGVNPVRDKKERQEKAAEARKVADELAFETYADLFGRKYIDAKKLRSAADIKSVIRRDLVPAFKKKPLPSIRKAEILDCLERVADRSTSAAVKADKWLRKIFAWAVGRGDINASPMDGMGKTWADGERDRVLDGDELRAVWMGAEAMPLPYSAFVKVLLLTGQRLREVAGMQWAEVDLDKAVWIIPASRTKSGAKSKRDLLVPLSPLVVSILEGVAPTKAARKGPVFTTNGAKPINGFSKPKALLDTHVTAALAKIDNTGLPMMQPWVFHDLRRSFSTGGQKLGFSRDHMHAAVGHVSGGGKNSKLDRTYLLYEFQPEKTAVMAAWARHVEAVVSGSKGNVVSLASARTEAAA